MAIRLIVMGVSGCGKSTLGEALAARWSTPFIEGDALHAPESVRKMAAGIALEDADRWPWLDRIGSALLGHGKGAVASCSALRRIYRDRLRQAVGPDLQFVMIDLPRAVLERRMTERTGHYMPPALLDSQLRTLERPEGENDVLVLDGREPMDALLQTVEQWRADT
ncbi:gluconokinase [Devosia crocina]|uniref:Gluconokinase n=1 Tax=Devosia crocina TaxID=429728 RepID=A0A1I7MZT8_9HYPH|nr:gluconokinase [Devosia crocina]SFV27836.1 gluconokinase [Devosia crocina]